MNNFLLGLQFLTRITIKKNLDWSEKACGGSVKFFPLIGGGLIMIPLFTFALTPSIFHSAPEIVGTSLFGVFLNALSGTYAYVKQHRVYFKAAIPFAIATLPGAILGSLVSDYFTGPTFSLSYGIFILIISAIMYWNSSNKKAIATNFDETLFIARKKLGIILSMFVGFISSIFGIGGGIIHVPVMIYALAFPPHMATATSHFVLAVSSFMGVTSHIFINTWFLHKKLLFFFRVENRSFFV